MRTMTTAKCWARLCPLSLCRQPEHFPPRVLANSINSEPFPLLSPYISKLCHGYFSTRVWWLGCLWNGCCWHDSDSALILLRPSEVGVPSAGDPRGLSGSRCVTSCLHGVLRNGVLGNQFNTDMEETNESPYANGRAVAATIITDGILLNVY